MTEEVVDLPLVPVTYTTRDRSASFAHRPRPPTRVTPAARSSSAAGAVGADARAS